MYLSLFDYKRYIFENQRDILHDIAVGGKIDISYSAGGISVIVKQYIKDFESCGLGIFVHFGIYSVLGKGEWAKAAFQMSNEEYEKLAERFCPHPDWARELAASARSAGAKYVTITTRHHDGFSLYDTQGLSEFDAVHYCGRDLIREFVDACRNEGLLPFFYHTLVDWHAPEYRSDHKKYLEYLRSSVEKLCTNYGKVGGLWFDGTWDKKDADWEEDALYAMIRSHQPEAMIINNTGLDALGALGHIELDSVTFERGKPFPINKPGAPKYIASEMCQVMNDHWGYAALDLNYSSMAHIIGEFLACRRYGANYLLNVGPMEDGRLRLIDRGILEELGKWIRLNEESIRMPRPTDIIIEGRPDDFILSTDDVSYLFVLDAPVSHDATRKEAFRTDRTVLSVEWLDNGGSLPFTQTDGVVEITALPFPYGTHLTARVAKIVYK